MNTHKLKILPEYFKAVQEGEKTFELRYNDKGFEVGDKIILREYDGVGFYTGKEIEKEVSYILDGFKGGLEEGYCILGLKKEGIRLKNIDLTGWNGEMQLNKINEEFKEFGEATAEYLLLNTQEAKEHAIEEYFDLVQSTLGLLAIAGISAEEVMKEYDKHLEKLKSRPRRKMCSKCINAKPYKLNENYFLCNGTIKDKRIEYAKECKCYEE